MKKVIFVTATLVLTSFVSPRAVAQSAEPQPVKWRFTAIPLNEKEAEVIFTANLDNGWHIYSQFMEEGGPMPTIFTFSVDRTYCLKGKVEEESTAVKEYDSIFMMPIIWYKNTAIFSQKIKLNEPATSVKGKIEFMACNGEMCLPPNAVSFNVEVKAAQPNKNSKGK